MIIFLVQILSILQTLHAFHLNNECSTWKAYSTYPINPKCTYFEDINLDQLEVIKKHTGCVQSHRVLTDDGYYITMHRLCPKTATNGTILFQHPLFTDGGIYIKQGPDSPAFFLWKRGYDVWVANMRGTPYSMDHVKYKYHEPAYWNWSLTEIGQYDVKAEVLHIGNQTTGPIYYMGHSLGTTAGLIFASKWPELSQQSIKHYVFMATAATLKDNQISLQFLASLEPILKFLVIRVLGWNNAFFFRPLAILAGGVIFRIFPLAGYFINLLMQAFLGKSDVVDPAFFNFDALKNEETASTKMLSHYLQLINVRSNFQEYDYGRAGNLVQYGSKTPPEFKFTNISSKMLFLSGRNDQLTPSSDADFFVDKYIKPTSIFWKHFVIPGMNHIDFATAKDRPALFYHIIETELGL